MPCLNTSCRNPTHTNGCTGRTWLLGAMACLALLTPVRADGPPPWRKDFRGTWADEAHCRWSAKVVAGDLDRFWQERP